MEVLASVRVLLFYGLPEMVGVGSGKYPEYSLEGLMLKLKFQYFGHLMRRTD